MLSSSLSKNTGKINKQAGLLPDTSFELSGRRGIGSRERVGWNGKDNIGEPCPGLSESFPSANPHTDNNQVSNSTYFSGNIQNCSNTADVRHIADSRSQSAQIPLPGVQTSVKQRRRTAPAAASAQTDSPPSPPYKDLLVVSATPEANLRLQKNTSQCDDPDILEQDFKAPCSSVVVGSCSNCGQHAIKVIYCGKEWCPFCGQADSPTHDDRYSKWLSRARQMPTMGYFVIEWPLIYRNDKNRVYSTKGLRKTTNKVVEIFAGKRMGRRGRVGGYFSRGMMRWHWAGDRCDKYNPHLNVLVESGFIQDEKLEEIKKALRDGLKCPNLIVNYSFRKTPGEMAHTCRYVTRPTFRDRDLDPYMAKELFETRNENDVVVPFRNSRTWGNWKQEPVWTTEGNEKYEKINRLRNRNECPGCGEHMAWSEPLDKRYLKVVESMGILKPVVRGYYEFKPDEYRGRYRGMDPTEEVNPITGELVPVRPTLNREMIISGQYEDCEIGQKITGKLASDIRAILQPLGLAPDREWILKRVTKIKAEMLKDIQKKE